MRCQAILESGERCAAAVKVIAGGTRCLCYEHYHFKKIELEDGRVWRNLQLFPNRTSRILDELLPGPRESGVCCIRLCETKVYRCSCLEHAFCEECLIECYCYSLDDGPVSFLCCMCEEESYTNIPRLSPEFRAKMEEVIARREVLKQALQPGWSSCPRCGMFATSSLEPCGKCGYEWCRDCRDKKHSSECEVIETKEDVVNVLARCLHIFTTKSCPGCHQATSHEGGCNKIVCKCGVIWCWLCRQILPSVTNEEGFHIVNPYDHFGGACGLWEAGPLIPRLELFRKLLRKNPNFEKEIRRAFPRMIMETAEFYAKDHEETMRANRHRSRQMIPRGVADFVVWIASYSKEIRVETEGNEINAFFILTSVTEERWSMSTFRRDSLLDPVTIMKLVENLFLNMYKDMIQEEFRTDLQDFLN
jgi:hypothetical protein